MWSLIDVQLLKKCQRNPTSWIKNFEFFRLTYKGKDIETLIHMKGFTKIIYKTKGHMQFYYFTIYFKLWQTSSRFVIGIAAETKFIFLSSAIIIKHNDFETTYVHSIIFPWLFIYLGIECDDLRGSTLLQIACITDKK